MATWISKPWIEQALMSRNGENLPKLARAQILKLEETSNNSVAFISDKKLYVKAVFSQIATEQFKRDNPSLSMADIQGGLIFIKKYSLQATCSMKKELDSAEFVIKIDEFKFAGGEGNTQFGSNITDSSTYPPLQPRLHELCRLSQVRTLLHSDSCGDGSITGFKEIERTLLENHEHVFIPEDMEKKLAEITEWKPSYCPPLSCDMQSETSSFGSIAPNGGLQEQTSISSMAVDCEQSLATKEKDCPESQSMNERGNCKNYVTENIQQRDNSQSTLYNEGFVERTTIDEKICAKSVESLHGTNICLSQTRQLEGFQLSNNSEDVFSSTPTPEKQKQREEILTNVHESAFTESCRESILRSTQSRSTQGEELVSSSSTRMSEPKRKQTDLNLNPERQDSPNVCTSNETKLKGDFEKECGLIVTTDGDESSSKCAATDCVADISSYAEVLKGLGQSHVLEDEIKGKGTTSNDSNSKFVSPQEESTVALISSDCVSSSQMSVVVTQPLKGLVAEEQCSSSSETSQLKGSSEESYSILKERSRPSAMKKSSEVNDVPSSVNSEEIEFEQPLQNITPRCTAKQLHCSLSESQLENLLETSISFDVGSAAFCFEDAHAENQEGYTWIKPMTLQQKETTPGNERSCPDSSHLGNIAVNPPCVASNECFTVKKTISENEHKKENSSVSGKISKGLEGQKDFETSTILQDSVNQTPSKALTSNFDALFSQNTWNFSQMEFLSKSDKELSASLIAIDRRQSVKRKRYEMEAPVRIICPSDKTREGNKAHLSDNPISPDSTSHSVKSSSHSGSSQSQLSNQSSSIYLTKPVDLYSQQDPLVLDTSAESAESTDGVIDNDSGLLITENPADDPHGNTSPSILERSMEEPCSLTTPTFDSLPSFQVPAINRETPPARDQECKFFSIATRHQDAEPCQEPGTNKKKRKHRRRKFDWFSDAF